MKKQNPPNWNRPQTHVSSGSSSTATGRTHSVQEAKSVPDRRGKSLHSVPERGQSLDAEDITLQREAKLRAVERRKARSRSVTMTVFVLVIMIFTVFIILKIMQQTAPKPEFMFIQNGVIEHTVGSTGLLIRNEVLMKSTAAGTVQPLVEEGNRVSYGQDIAMIIAKGAEASLTALENVEQQISDLQRELINDGKGPGARVIYQEADEDIAELVNLIRKECIQDTMLNMISYETSISVILERRDTRLLSIEFNDSRLDELKQQKKDLEDALGIHSGTITSKIAGIVSYNIDGLEEILTIAKIPLLTVNEYNTYIGENAGYATTGREVESEQPIVRITSGIYQYLAFLLPDTKEGSFVLESVHTIKDPLDAVTIENCVVKRTMIIGDDLFVIFQTDRRLERFSDRRTISADITTSSSEGLKIPISAIIGFDEVARTGQIMIVSGGYTRKAKIQIVDYDRSNAIIKAVEGEQYIPSLNGYLVVNPESIEEGVNITETD
jgi:hypothetical protein